MSVLLGNGAGGFAQAAGSPITVGPTPYGVEIADFDADRNPDLAIANQFDDFVSILLGDGTGQFTPAAGSPIHFGAGGPTWLVAADFDDDRDIDLAVALGSGSVRVLLGDGTGGFAPAPGSPIALPGRPHNLRAADFDRDGELDLGLDRIGAPGLGIPPSFSVLLGDGQGGFQLAGTPNPVGAQPFSMAVGDFNRDRKPDVAVGNNLADSVSVLLNATTTPADAIASLRDEVWASAVARELRVSLTAKLLIAEWTAGVLENRPACLALDAFVAEVQANDRVEGAHGGHGAGLDRGGGGRPGRPRLRGLTDRAQPFPIGRLADLTRGERPCFQGLSRSRRADSNRGPQSWAAYACASR